MKNPAASLYEDLSRIEEALEPFNAPQTNEHAGLRWMRQTLVERHEHVQNQITGIERSTLTVTVGADADATAAPPAETVAALVTAVQQEVWVAARSLDWPDQWPESQRDTATTLQVAAAGHADDQWYIELQRPAGPLEAQPTMPDGEHLVFDAAVGRLLDGLEERRHDHLLRMVLDTDLPLTLTLAAVTTGTRTLELNQQAVQSLLLS
jgi:hypothetical protein